MYEYVITNINIDKIDVIIIIEETFIASDRWLTPIDIIVIANIILHSSEIMDSKERKTEHMPMMEKGRSIGFM